MENEDEIKPTLLDLQEDRTFTDPNTCADYIMDQLYDGPRHPSDNPPRRGEWVVAILGHTGLFFPYREWDCLEEGHSYFRITFNPDGLRILEGEA